MLYKLTSHTGSRGFISWTCSGASLEGAGCQSILNLSYVGFLHSAEDKIIFEDFYYLKNSECHLYSCKNEKKMVIFFPEKKIRLQNCICHLCIRNLLVIYECIIKIKNLNWLFLGGASVLQEGRQTDQKPQPGREDGQGKQRQAFAQRPVMCVWYNLYMVQTMLQTILSSKLQEWIH